LLFLAKLLDLDKIKSLSLPISSGEKSESLRQEYKQIFKKQR